MNRTCQAGLTLVEMTITLLVVLVTLSAAVPSFQQARERRQLDGAAAQIATDLRHARSVAVAQGRTIRFTVRQSDAGACYLVHSGAAADCDCNTDGTATCRSGAQSFQSAGFPAGAAVRLSSNVSSMSFDADRGTVSPTGTLRLALPSGPAVHQVVNIMGRVRSCSPGGLVRGQPAC